MKLRRARLSLSSQSRDTDSRSNGMETKTVEGTIENAYGQPLASPLTYSGSYNVYTSYDEVPGNERLSEADMLKVVNDKERANARQKAMQAALDAAGIKKPTLDDPSVQLATMVKVLRAAGKTEEEATQQAKALLGL